MRENNLDGLGFVKFFDPKTVGIEVEGGDKGVKVKHVRKASIFDQKLQPTDVVMGIDGAKSPDAEQFRRLLRKSLANTDAFMSFSVLRAGETKQVKIKVP